MAKMFTILVTARRFVRDLSGSVAVEFALMTPVLTIALIALADYGMMVHKNTQLSEAASAGIRFALIEGNAENDSGIEAAVRATLFDANDDNATVTITRECRCPTGAAVTCSFECGSDVRPGRYLEVVVNTSYDMIFDYPHIGDVSSLQSHAAMRIPNP